MHGNIPNTHSAEVEEETAVEAEAYFDCIEEDSSKGQVDLDLSDDSPASPSTCSSPKKGQLVRGCALILFLSCDSLECSKTLTSIISHLLI